MAWQVLFWNIQGTAKGNVKLDVVKKAIELVKPDIICFAEVGLKFPYEEFPNYRFQEHLIQDKDEKDTPKGLALGVRATIHEIHGKLTPLHTTLMTSKGPVKLARPILTANVSGVEVIIAHAPSSGGPLGRVTVAEICDYFRDQCRRSRGHYQGFAVGDFNAQFSPFMMHVDEVYEEIDTARRLKRTSTYFYSIQSRDPKWDITQKSGGVIDFMITCGVVARAETNFHRDIDLLNSSLYLPKWPSTPKTSVLVDTKESSVAGIGTLVLKPSAETDSVYADVKGALDKQFKVVAGATSEIAGWHIDHRPIIYDLITAGGSPGAPRIVESGL
ncbi:Hypothetical protein A7982_11650 [Minicystis rosea]|nr:Hypothetical protein A7982_11650 [Minicystis rosea]